MDFLWAALIAGGAGATLVVMQALNASLGAQLGSPVWASLVNYVVSTATIGLVLIAFREPWPLAAAARVSPQFWLGGVVRHPVRPGLDFHASEVGRRDADRAVGGRSNARFADRRSFRAVWCEAAPDGHNAPGWGRPAGRRGFTDPPLALVVGLNGPNVYFDHTETVVAMVVAIL